MRQFLGLLLFIAVVSPPMIDARSRAQEPSGPGLQQITLRRADGDLRFQSQLGDDHQSGDAAGRRDRITLDRPTSPFLSDHGSRSGNRSRVEWFWQTEAARIDRLSQRRLRSFPSEKSVAVVSQHRRGWLAPKRSQLVDAGQ